MRSRMALPMNVDLHAAFTGRRSLGRLLAGCLREMVLEDALVLGVVRGGVVVADEVARTLDLPMEVLVVHRITEPDGSHLSLGAVAEPGRLVLNRQMLHAHPVDRAWLRTAVDDAVKDVTERGTKYRAGRPRLQVSGRQVILIEDAAGTGAILRSAVKAVKSMGAREVIVAVPVAPERVVAALRRQGAHVLCFCSPPALIRNDIHYPPPDEVTDHEICHLLAYRSLGEHARV